MGQSTIQLRIDKPANNGSVDLNQNVEIQTELTPSAESISKVEFYIDGSYIGSATPPRASFVWNSGATAGEHKISVRAVYRSGEGAAIGSEIKIRVKGKQNDFANQGQSILSDQAVEDFGHFQMKVQNRWTMVMGGDIGFNLGFKSYSCVGAQINTNLGPQTNFNLGTPIVNFDLGWRFGFASDPVKEFRVTRSSCEAKTEALAVRELNTRLQGTDVYENLHQAIMNRTNALSSQISILQGELATVEKDIKKNNVRIRSCQTRLSKNDSSISDCQQSLNTHKQLLNNNATVLNNTQTKINTVISNINTFGTVINRIDGVVMWG